MKIRNALLATSLLLAAQTANAALILSINNVTTTSISISMTGTLSAGTGTYPIPDNYYAGWLTIEAPGGTEWITNNGTTDTTLTKYGMTPINGVSFVSAYASRGDSFGDFVRFSFYYPLVAGTATGNGLTMTLTSDTPIFDPNVNKDALALYWGYFGESGTPFGVYQSGGTAVPEPATYAGILGVMALGAAGVKRLRKHA